MPIRPAALALAALTGASLLAQPAAADSRNGVPANPFASNYPSLPVAPAIEAKPRRVFPARRSRERVRR